MTAQIEIENLRAGDFSVDDSSWRHVETTAHSIVAVDAEKPRVMTFHANNERDFRAVVDFQRFAGFANVSQFGSENLKKQAPYAKQFRNRFADAVPREIGYRPHRRGRRSNEPVSYWSTHKTPAAVREFGHTSS